ncbi:MAG TPA: DUF6515 family protein [Smithella sp.]|nr:DUF6515 family protein [Smithella sp.]
MKKLKNTMKYLALIIMLGAFFGIMSLGYSTEACARMQGGSSFSHGGSHSFGGAFHSHGVRPYHSYYSYGRWGHYPYYYRGWRGWGYYYGWPWFSVIPFLPLYYETIWVGDLPYYYANGIYYAPTEGGYMIVDPPQDAVSAAPPSQDAMSNNPSSVISEPPEGKLFIYPRNGQTDKQQEEDRYQCHHWAVGQTNYDPTMVAGTPSIQKRADYQRAMAACLDAHGYTVR